jgi:hypothetical protein
MAPRDVLSSFVGQAVKLVGQVSCIGTCRGGHTVCLQNITGTSSEWSFRLCHLWIFTGQVPAKVERGDWLTLNGDIYPYKRRDGTLSYSVRVKRPPWPRTTPND